MMLLRVLHRKLRLFPLQELCHNCTYRYYTDGATTDHEAGFKEIKTTASSLRIDNIASKGLGISRRAMWELLLEGQVTHNGSTVEKKSTLVKEGDVIDVDSQIPSAPGSQHKTETRRGRVVVKQIQGQTRRGGWHVTLLRKKHFATTNKPG